MSTKGFKFQRCPTCAKRGVWLTRNECCGGVKLRSKWMCRYCSWWRWEEDWAEGFDKVVEAYEEEGV